MTTDKYLSQISRIDHAIANKLEEIKRLSDMATSISISPKEVDVQSSGNPDKMGSAVSKIVDLQNEIQTLVDELVNKRRIIISQIDSMDNTDVYIVLSSHYSYRNIMKLRKRALQEFERRYGQLYSEKSA